MTNRLIVLTIVLLVSSLPLLAQKNSEADKLLKELVTDKGNVGMAAGYMVDGQLKWTKAAGHSCKDQNILFSEQTLTRIASISKSMTAIAIMQLVEKGKLQLDVNIQTYLPNFPKKEKGEITIRQLLSHTSGMSAYDGKKEVQNEKHFDSLDDAMAIFINRPLLFEPGSAYAYTTYGYVILGKIIEQVSAMSYEQYMQKNIWDVVGMKQTGIEKMGVTYDNKSCLYQKGKRKTKKSKQNDLSNRVPGGGIYSSLQDLIKFGQAVLDGKLLADSSLQMMLQSQPVTYEGNQYGLGWRFYGPKGQELMVVGHDGGQTGCTSQLLMVPESKIIVVVLSNTSRTYKDIVAFAGNLARMAKAEKD
ncbi:MAG: serine hydrolase domain-containing protein [Bacteroidota bacterium]